MVERKGPADAASFELRPGFSLLTRLSLLLAFAAMVVSAIVDPAPWTIALPILFAAELVVISRFRLRVTDGIVSFVPLWRGFRWRRGSPVNLKALSRVRVGPRWRLIGQMLYVRDMDRHRLWVSSDYSGWPALVALVARSIGEDVQMTPKSRSRLSSLASEGWAP